MVSTDTGRPATSASRTGHVVRHQRVDEEEPVACVGRDAADLDRPVGGVLGLGVGLGVGMRGRPAPQPGPELLEHHGG